jgi:nucleoside-diphosphate-sugar epimerase
MKILITGVAGFIGSNLADQLLKENSFSLSVTGVDNLSYGIREQIPNSVELHQVDIRSKEIYPLFAGIDYVFHLAAKNCISGCQADPVETADVNVTGTVNVFEAARRAKVKKVIYAESSAIYEGSQVFPTPESEEKPESFYAVSKICGNLFAQGYRKYFGLKMVGLRYFNVYGPRQDYRRTIPPIMSAFIIKLLKGEQPIIYGDGSKKRDFVHIEDINAFHIQCMTDPRTDGKVFNIGSGKNYSVLEIYEMISEILGVKISPIFKPNLPGEAQDNLADITKAKKLGWYPSIDIKAGLKDMIEYIRGEIALGRI